MFLNISWKYHFLMPKNHNVNNFKINLSSEQGTNKGQKPSTVPLMFIVTAKIVVAFSFDKVIDRDKYQVWSKCLYFWFSIMN